MALGQFFCLDDPQSALDSWEFPTARGTLRGCRVGEAAVPWNFSLGQSCDAQSQHNSSKMTSRHRNDPECQQNSSSSLFFFPLQEWKLLCLREGALQEFCIRFSLNNVLKLSEILWWCCSCIFRGNWLFLGARAGQ